MDGQSNGENVGENLDHSSASHLNLSLMTNLIYVRACVPVSAPAHYANARVYARARNNCVRGQVGGGGGGMWSYSEELLCSGVVVCSN